MQSLHNLLSDAVVLFVVVRNKEKNVNTNTSLLVDFLSLYVSLREATEHLTRKAYLASFAAPGGYHWH